MRGSSACPAFTRCLFPVCQVFIFHYQPVEDLRSSHPPRTSVLLLMFCTSERKHCSHGFKTAARSALLLLSCFGPPASLFSTNVVNGRSSELTAPAERGGLEGGSVLFRLTCILTVMIKFLPVDLLFLPAAASGKARLALN